MNIVDSIWAQIHAHPQHIALRVSEETLRFAHLGELIRCFARFLLESGIRRGEIVGLQIEPELPHLLCSLALAHIGAGQYSIAGRASDHTLHASRLLGIEKTLVMSNNTAVVFGSALPIESVLRQPRAYHGPDNGPEQDGLLPWLARSSSGTTGTPKVFAISHQQGGCRRNRYDQVITAGPGDVFHSMTPLHFGAAKQRVYYSLSRGCAVAFAPRLAVDQLPSWLERHGVTNLYCVPIHLDQLVDLACEQSPRPGACLLPGVRQLETSSAVVTSQLRTQVKARVTPNLVISYSVSEVGHISATELTGCEVEEHSVGRILAGVNLEIVDRNDTPVLPGQPGLIRLKCPGMIDRYWAAEERYVAALRDGWFFPGDLGCISPTKQLIFHGRADDMMIFNGINIYPAEIEQVLLQHPAVRDAVAFPVKSSRHQDIPVAAIIPGANVSRDELAAYCAQHLGERKPLAFIFLEQFPRNAMGKIVRRELAAMATVQLQLAMVDRSHQNS